jgi:AcrR family transcriptional regulator
VETKEIILEKSLNLFMRRGYEATSIEDICISSNVTKDRLEQFYKNKREVLEELLDRYFRLMDETVKSATRYSGDLAVTLERIVYAYFTFAKENREFYRLQLSLVFGPPENEATMAVLARMAPQYIFTGEMFRHAAYQHSKIGDKEFLTAANFIGMINTYISFHIHGQNELENKDVIHAVQHFMYGIA